MKTTNEKLAEISQVKAERLASRCKNLSVYIEFGKNLSQLQHEIPSRKERGREIALRWPESQKLDPALRSHCRWLYEALNNPIHPDKDILSVLDVDTIYDICSDTETENVIIFATVSREMLKAFAA